MINTLMPNPKNQFLDTNGNPLANGNVYTYAAGTSTLKATYTDAAGTTPQPNPIPLNARGEPANKIVWAGNYKVEVRDAQGNVVYTVDDYNTDPAGLQRIFTSSGASLVGYLTGRTVDDKLKEVPSVFDRGAKGTGADDDTAGIKNAVSLLPQRGALSFPAATAYKITDTIEVFGKAGAVLDFGNQQINSGTFSGTPKPAIHFKGMSQAIIDGIFVIGSKIGTSAGVLFEAEAGNITIHAKVGKIYVSGCDVGIQVGTATTFQVSDSNMEDLYASDCNLGVVLSGENTLAMRYGRIAAYNNSTIGVHFEQGGGSIESLQVAASGSDLYFGQTSGLNHGKLARWDILSGYSEQGVNKEVFINSARCTDTNPFREQVVISGFRVTPFTSTNVPDFIQWRLNGDLVLRNVTINHGQQLPRIKVDANPAFRQPRVLLDDCTIDCSPKGEPQVMMSYLVTDPRQQVEINASVDNGMTWWNNDGNANEGKIKRGVYMRKLQKFEAALLSIGSLAAAWSLRDITSGVCRSLVPSGPQLAVSATLEPRDFWLDDGLVGFFRNATSSKTVSSSSGALSAGEYTFGCFLRCSTGGIDETEHTALGGPTGIRLGIGNTGGAFARVQVGGFNCQAAPTNPYDAHLLIGRFRPKDPVGTEPGHLKLDCINLRTGEISSARVDTGPALADFVWANGISIRNDGCVRGLPFVYKTSLADSETLGLLQSAMQLTDSWRDA